jgi:hypothetical protein
LLAAAAVTAGAVGTAGALALSGSASASVASPATGRPATLTVKQIAFGKKLHHTFRVNGTGAVRSEALFNPDDISELGPWLFVGFQNGVGSQGETASNGNQDSTVVQFNLQGKEVTQWDVKGKVDGLTVDPLTLQVIETVNEDAHSSLYTISPFTRTVVHYAYSRPLPHNGGTDAIGIYQGQVVVSASAPGTTGKAAPQAAYPALYAVQLNSRTKIATVYPLYSDEAPALALNGPHKGHYIRLGLTDPDSNEVVPSASAAFRGDFMLDSQGDQQLIFANFSWFNTALSVLNLPASIDDSAWILFRGGGLYTTDSTADTVDVITGPFTPGTMYAAVTPCNANSAPATCPAPGFPANYLGTINLKTGAITKAATKGATVNPKGMIYVPVIP